MPPWANDIDMVLDMRQREEGAKDKKFEGKAKYLCLVATKSTPNKPRLRFEVSIVGNVQPCSTGKKTVKHGQTYRQHFFPHCSTNPPEILSTLNDTESKTMLRDKCSLAPSFFRRKGFEWSTTLPVFA